MTAIRPHAIPCTRDLPSSLRRARLQAARCYARGSIPRFAILLGHWDGGRVVNHRRDVSDGDEGQPES